MSKYRTAMGKTIDMSALATRFEKTRAVGNMKVNARGDSIDADNKVVHDNTKRVNNTYTKSVSKRPTPNATNPVPKSQEKINLAELNAHERELEEDDDEDIKK